MKEPKRQAGFKCPKDLYMKNFSTSPAALGKTLYSCNHYITSDFGEITKCNFAKPYENGPRRATLNDHMVALHMEKIVELQDQPRITAHFAASHRYERPLFPATETTKVHLSMVAAIVELNHPFSDCDKPAFYKAADDLNLNFPRFSRKQLVSNYLPMIYNSAIEAIKQRVKECKDGEITVQLDGYDAKSGRKVVSIILLTSI